MFSKAIFKQTLKGNYKLWLIFTILMCVMNALIIAVFDPKMISGMMKDMPMADMMGEQLTSMTSLLGKSFYTMQGVMLTLIFVIMTANSLVSVQVFHGGVFSKAYTKDASAVAGLIDKDKEEVEDNLDLILENQKAVKKGAKARGIDVDVYTAYLNQKITEQSSKGNDAAPEMDEAAKQQMAEMQNKFLDGITEASDVLDMTASDLASDIRKIKDNTDALNAAIEASDIPKEMFMSIINEQLAASEVQLDEGIDFNIRDYLMMNLGAFLLMFAISSISFLFSCIFNLSKNSLALGAGIPIAFFIFQIMSQVGENLETFKYFTLNTLFDTDAITNGDSYTMQFIILGIMGVLLYTIGMKIFEKKDLPL